MGVYSFILEKIKPFEIISEFYKDYNSFLLFLKNSLFTQFGDSKIEILLKEMFCIKMDRKGDVFLFLQEFNKIHYLERTIQS